MSRGRPKQSVLERANAFLDVDITKELSDNDKDQHWIWRGTIKPPRTRIKYNPHTQSMTTNTGYTVPIRIRDDDGRLKAAIRVLFRELRGVEFPYAVKRTHGCDYRCVNPFHVALPEGLNEEFETPPVLDASDEIAGLMEEIAAFIGINGRDDDQIKTRFLIDYTEDEINQALGMLE
jgi:hypothetical protein